MASIRKLANGRWQAQFRPYPNGKQITRTTQRKVDAQRWLDEQMATIVTGQFVDPKASKITFGSYFELWAARQIWVRGTRVNMNLAARSVTFWSVPLQLLRRSHVESWIKTMEVEKRGNGRGGVRTTGLKPSTVRTRFKAVRTILLAAVADRRLSTDPCAGVRLPRPRRKEASATLPTIDAVRALLNAADSRFRVFIALCAFAGLRLGEASALQVHDIDFTKGVLTVSRQAQLGDNNTTEIRIPKFASERRVYLPKSLLFILSAHIATLSPDCGPDAWLFTGHDGKPMRQIVIWRLWGKTKQAANIEGVRLHDLRHFYASGLIGSGCDVVAVQRALGHSSATVTLNSYAHLWPRSEDRTRAAAASMFAEVTQWSDEWLTNKTAAPTTGNSEATPTNSSTSRN